MPLNPQQKKAVEYLEGPLLVLAGPGTGKTQLLSEKVAYILKNTDTNPENILCLTFTETGAANMRERLKTLIGKDGQKVNIGTYHAFGSEILAQYKNYSPDYDRKLDAAIDEVTQFKIVKKLRDSLPGTDILRGDNVKGIISVISEAKSATLSSADLAEIARYNLEDSDFLSREISPLLEKIVPRNYTASLENAYAPIYAILKTAAEKSTPISARVDRIVVGITADLKAALIEASETDKVKPLTAWKDTYFEKTATGKFRLKDRIANQKLKSIAKVMALYEDYLKGEGLYDFDDMIEEAVKILSKDEGFKFTLEERYQFIMLDEFQDTNPSQLAIVKALTDYEYPMIMAVGDDDQAIYEFQGAKSTNLTDFQAHYHAEVIPLVENYRSTQEILDFSRKVINEAPDRFADKELFAHQPDPKTSQIFRREFLSSEQEYAFVAAKIADLLKSGVPAKEIAILSYKTKYFLPLLPFLKAHPEIKIAYEKRDNLLEDEKIHEILTICRLAAELAAGGRLSVSLAEVLSFPFFELPALEIVRLLNRARTNRENLFEACANSENPKIKAVIEFLSNLAAKSFSEPLEIFLDYVLGATELNGFRSPFLSYYAHFVENTGAVDFPDSTPVISPKDTARPQANHPSEYEIFRLYENLASLRGKLNRHFGDQPLKLAHLLEMITDYEDAEMTMNVTSPYRDAEDAVQLLTAHKAKGLEFKYVFLLSADHTAWGKGKGNNNLLSLPKNLAFIRHTGTTDGEKLRILYVALTRAKSALIITNSLSDFTGKSPERLEYLEEYEGKDENTGEKVVFSPLIPRGQVDLAYNTSAVDFPGLKEQKSYENLALWFSPFAAENPDMRAIYREKLSSWRLSATALTSFIDIVYAGPTEFFKHTLLGVSSDPETEQIAVGNLVHKVFEAVTNNGLSDAEATDFYLKELEKSTLPTEIVAKLREKGPADLAVALKAFGSLLREGRAEVNLAAEKLSTAGVPLTGKIDHISINETEKSLEIYDFKTAAYHKDRWQSHLGLYKYMLQLCFYKLLLNTSPTYAKYKISRAHILFVIPDKDGEVYDKVYDFNDTDNADLIALIRAVYSEISTLNFLNDPEIFLPPDSSKKLSDIKDFVALLLSKNHNTP